MKIYSSHRRKLEAKRRFGGQEFRSKVKEAQNYKRTFDPNPTAWYKKILSQILKGKKLWRNVAILSGVIIFYYLVISPRFVVSEIKISGNVQVSTQSIIDVLDHSGQSRLFLIKKNNYFMLSKGRVETLLTEELPTIKEVNSFKRVWPNGIEFQVRERIPGFTIKSNNKYFLVDEEGVVVKQIDTPNNLLVIEDVAVEDFASGEALPNPKVAPFVLSMTRLWPAKISTTISLVKITGKNTNDVQFQTAEGWSVLFDTTRSVSLQLTNLSAILNKQISAKDRTRLAYIDLRLSKWAYYCFKASPCQQQPQPEESINNQQK